VDFRQRYLIMISDFIWHYANPQSPRAYFSAWRWEGRPICFLWSHLPNSTKRLLSEFDSFRPRRRGKK